MIARRLPAIAVLCSGEGTNLQAILTAIHEGRLRARVAVVISDRAQARALLRASRAGAEARFVDPARFPTKARYERALISLLDARRVRLVCLAGFMRLLSPAFVRHYPRRILNIHPALLPAFPGARAIRDALAWGVKVTGVTVHFVDEEVDHGPILLQETVTVMPGESPSQLLARLHRVEHRLYPEAIRLVLAGRVKVMGRSVKIAEKR
ncbi:MAG: phosphoribosylglycinamide formyltransferase [Candidatus Omnitrophota bacterium]|nr:phosphoribosylglycinamide formyltransferase [Candidatus Omnitrophota bacterium]